MGNENEMYVVEEREGKRKENIGGKMGSLYAFHFFHNLTIADGVNRSQTWTPHKGSLMVNSQSIGQFTPTEVYTPVSYTHLTLPTKRIV